MYYERGREEIRDAVDRFAVDIRADSEATSMKEPGRHQAHVKALKETLVNSSSNLYEPNPRQMG